VLTLLTLAAAVAFSSTVQSTTATYAKGDVVRLAAQANGDPLPDSRVLAVAGDRIQIDRKKGILVNGEPVKAVSQQFLDQVAEPWDQVVPAGHYFVIAERQTSASTVRYHGLIPAAKIVAKLSK
jgi:signal peptidase I